MSGFTLIELVVALFIVSILASLSLAGIAGANQRARTNKTRSTIRKLNELILPHYEGYMRKRVRIEAVEEPTSSTCPSCFDASVSPLARRVTAWKSVVSKRRSILFEMPDTWADVGTAPAGWQTAPTRAYASLKTSVRAAEYGAQECLYMVISRGGFDLDALETFRSDEIVDKDEDGVPEFVDGWGTPIAWLRWAPGFNAPNSFVQFSDATNHHDPFDPFRVDQNGYALVPLIVSAGPDRSFGLNVATRQAAGWNGLDLASLVHADSVTGGPDGSGDHFDNVSNHTFASE